MNELGKKIKELRTIKKWSLDELSIFSGIPKTTIWGIEKGSQPSYDKITKLAAALDVPVNTLLGIKKDGTSYSIPGLYVCGTDSESIEDMLNISNSETYKEEYMKMADKYSIKFINDLVIEKPYDKKISDIKKKIDNGESLSDEDKKIIDTNAKRKKLEKDFGLTDDIGVMDYEKESYMLFKKLLISLGYDNETAKPYLFKKIKAQIELEINMQKEQR